MYYDDDYGNPVYYRIYLTKENKLTVVTMQEFDEYDYHEHKFAKENGKRLKFKDEETAVDYLNKHFRSEFIDEEFLTPNHIDFMRRNYE